MASNNEEQVSREKPDSTMEQAPQKPKDRLAGCRTKCLIPGITLIVALGALGTASYTLFLNKQLQHQSAHFPMQVQHLEQTLETVQEQLHAKVDNSQNAQSQLQNKLEHLDKQVQNVMSQRFYHNQDWLLLKARYYLELAQINAHWSSNFDSTISLLQQADQLLTQLNDPKIFEIRQAIAKDISQLQAIPLLDSAGILSTLDAAQNTIKELSIPLPANTSESAADQAKTSDNSSSSWRLHLHDSINALEKLVVIRRHDHEVKPLISPLLEAILKEKLSINLQEAQWAVLNKNPFVYQLVLKQAITNLKTNFNENTQNTAALIKKLTQLQQVKLSQKKPDIKSALPLLNELIDARQAIVNQTIKEGQGENQQ